MNLSFDTLEVSPGHQTISWACSQRSFGNNPNQVESDWQKKKRVHPELFAPIPCGRMFCICFFHWFNKGTLDVLQEQVYIKEKAALLIVEVAKRDWPEEWKTLEDDLSRVAAAGERQTELVCNGQPLLFLIRRSWSFISHLLLQSTLFTKICLKGASVYLPILSSRSFPSCSSSSMMCVQTYSPKFNSLDHQSFLCVLPNFHPTPKWSTVSLSCITVDKHQDIASLCWMGPSPVGFSLVH